MNSVITRNPDRFTLLGVESISSELPELNGVLAVDTETTGLEFTEDVVYSVQVGDGNNYIFDMQSVEFSEVLKLLDDKPLIFHNDRISAVVGMADILRYDFRSYPKISRLRSIDNI